MTYDQLFEAYHNLLRAEEDTPDSTDDEYIVGIRLANEAINRWANYDATKWRELYVSASLDSLSGTNTYAAPADMQELGGYVSLGSSKLPIVQPHEAQFNGSQGNYAYFTGDPNNGFTLNFNRDVDVTGTGNIHFVYYKKPTLITTGTDVPEMADPYFIVHRMLAQRLRPEENYGSYQIALRDSENALKQMKMSNDSGNWSRPPVLSDMGGGTWGGSGGGSFFREF